MWTPSYVFYTVRYELHSPAVHRGLSFSGLMLQKQLSGNKMNSINVELWIYIHSFIYTVFLFFISLNHLSHTIWQHIIYSLNVFFRVKSHINCGAPVSIIIHVEKNNYSLFAPIRRHFLRFPAIQSIILESLSNPTKSQYMLYILRFLLMVLQSKMFLITNEMLTQMIRCHLQ